MIAQIAYTMEAAKEKFSKKPGFIQLFGLDYVIDSDFNTYLIEIN